MKTFSLLASLFLFIGCHAITDFDQVAYTAVINTKVDAWNLMAKSGQSYSSCQSDINDFQTEMRKAYEYDKNRPINADTVKQWEIMINPQGGLLGTYLAEWQQEGSISHPRYIQFRQKQIGLAFDEIAQLEQHKQHVTQ